MHHPAVLIRDATAADCAEIAAIYAETVRAHDATMDLEPRAPEYFAALIAALTPREAFCVMELGGAFAGWGRIMAYSDRAGYELAGETAVYLRRDLRRRGLGTLFKRHLIERCRALGYHHLVAKVFARNQASIEYNRRLGYELVGVQREIGWVKGRWEDVAILQLVFSDTAPGGDAD